MGKPQVRIERENHGLLMKSAITNRRTLQAEANAILAAHFAGNAPLKRAKKP